MKMASSYLNVMFRPSLHLDLIHIAKVTNTICVNFFWPYALGQQPCGDLVFRSVGNVVRTSAPFGRIFDPEWSSVNFTGEPPRSMLIKHNRISPGTVEAGDSRI